MDFVDVEYYLPNSWDANETSKWLNQRWYKQDLLKFNTQLLPEGIFYTLQFYIKLRTYFLQ